MNLRALLLTVTLAIGLGGCWFGKKAKVAPPPPAPKPAAPAPARPPAPEPAKTEPPQPLPTRLPGTPNPAIVPAPEPVKTETPQPPPKKKRAPAPKAAPAIPATPVPVTAPPGETAPAVKLEEILTDDRRRQYETDFTSNVTEARAVLKRASTRRLNAAQKQSVGRIQTFLQQADEAKDSNLATAVQLAHRADLLAQDLLTSLK